MTLPTVEHETGPSPAFAVIWLHGLGADGNDFAPIVPELVDPSWPALRFVFPHAPVRPVTINNGAPMRAWYDILSFSPADRQVAPGIREAITDVEALIKRENERGVPSANIILAGFSQGGAVALSAGLRHADTLAGIAGLSTYLPLVESLADERSAANAHTPVFLAHGTADPVLSLAMGSASRDALLAIGTPVAWHEYPMAHQVCVEEIDALRRWIGARLRG